DPFRLIERTTRAPFENVRPPSPFSSPFVIQSLFTRASLGRRPVSARSIASVSAVLPAQLDRPASSEYRAKIPYAFGSSLRTCFPAKHLKLERPSSAIVKLISRPWPSLSHRTRRAPDDRRRSPYSPTRSRRLAPSAS